MERFTWILELKLKRSDSDVIQRAIEIQFARESDKMKQYHQIHHSNIVPLIGVVLIKVNELSDRVTLMAEYLRDLENSLNRHLQHN